MELSDAYMHQGLVYTGRKEGRLTSEKVEFQRPASDGAVVPDGSSFAEAVRRIRPTAIIGAAARRGVFDAEVIRALVQATPCSSSESVDQWRILWLFYPNKSIFLEALQTCLPVIFPVRCDVAGHRSGGGQCGSPPGAGAVKPRLGGGMHSEGGA